MKDTLLSLAVLFAILISSALITNWFARAMYNRCATCGALNAKRRAECAALGARPLAPRPPDVSLGFLRRRRHDYFLGGYRHGR